MQYNHAMFFFIKIFIKIIFIFFYLKKKLDLSIGIYYCVSKSFSQSHSQKRKRGKFHKDFKALANIPNQPNINGPHLSKSMELSYNFSFGKLKMKHFLYYQNSK